MDIDMIHTDLLTPKRKIIREVMKSMGFYENGRYFEHKNTELFVDFPKGPPAVGQEPVKYIKELYVDTGILKLISPTDCVKDRLTWFYYNNDQQCLYQAILVSNEIKIDIEEVERWSIAEGMIEKFEQIKKRFTKK